MKMIPMWDVIQMIMTMYRCDLGEAFRIYIGVIRYIDRAVVVEYSPTRVSAC